MRKCLYYIPASLRSNLIFAVLMTTCSYWPGAAVAQSGEPPCAQECFVLTGIHIQGVTAYPLAELAHTYEDYLTRSIGVDDLVTIAASITDHYRADGYFLTRAAVAPHSGGDGSATIVVYEGYVDDVIVEGPGFPAIRSLVQPLGGPRPLSIDELDRRLTLASDVPGYTLESRIEPVLGDPAGHRLVVTPKFRKYAGSASVENRGTEAQGPWQVYLSANANSVLSDGDQLTLSTLTTPERIDELTFAEAAYSMSAGNGRRLRFAVSGYTTDAPPSSTNGWLSGRSASVAVNLAQPLIRKRKQSLWLNTGLDVRQVRQTYAGSGQADETLAVARLSLAAWRQIDGGYLSGSLQVSQGLNAFGATVQNAPQLTRNDADGIFTKLNLNVSGYRDLGRYFGVYAQVSAQWSGDPLLNAEEFFVGGSPFGRAYNYGEISGDKAIAATVELRAGWAPNLPPISFFQAYAFYDAAAVSNYAINGDRSDELSSAGVGVRVTLKERTTFKAEIAKPLDWTPFTETDNDWRAFVSLSQQF